MTVRLCAHTHLSHPTLALQHTRLFTFHIPNTCTPTNAHSNISCHVCARTSHITHMTHVSRSTSAALPVLQLQCPKVSVTVNLLSEKYQLTINTQQQQPTLVVALVVDFCLHAISLHQEAMHLQLQQLQGATQHLSQSNQPVQPANQPASEQASQPSSQQSSQPADSQTANNIWIL